ncbi:dipeptidase [Aeromicrobium sp. A1-2]|uniref:dipeptidase n=1 Tax=Aeromicrobium sp. A1-2 TaxID=2107713 RepID=UPI0013C31181|nr:membrane dipeptidase [Aeromicrobium sp. A1-2]
MARRLVVDAHAHGTKLLPRPVKSLHRRLTRDQPAEVDFGQLAAAGVDVLVAAAVGDGLVTRFRRPLTPWRAVVRQLEQIKAEASAGGCGLLLTREELRSAGSGQPAIILGLEGADPVGDDLSRVEELGALGVRVVGIMHYADNKLGTICMNFRGGESGHEVAAGRSRGLTALGRECVGELNARGMLIDVAHADAETIDGICEYSDAPVISSHTGARALDDFGRYLPDHSIRSIADTGGMIGLWPYRGPEHGMPTFDDFARHAEHIANIVGPERLCIGTDMNGVTSLIEGYDGPHDIGKLWDALTRIGFSSTDIDGISGTNVAQLL